MDQIGTSSVVQNDSEHGEDPIGEGRQTTAAKYMEQWKIMQRVLQQIRRRMTMEARQRCGIMGIVDKVISEENGG